MNKFEVSSIPPNWAVATVNDLGQFINGFAFKPDHWGDGGVPIVRIQNLTNSSKPFNYTKIDVPEIYSISNGDLLVSWSATLDAFIWKGGSAWLNQHIFKVIPSKYFHPGLSYYWMKIAIEQMVNTEHLHGSTMKHINRGPFLAHETRIPPYGEQVEIFNKIEELFSHIDAGVEGLKQAKAKLQQYRQSVLKDAVTGKLTEKWREQNADKLQPADELLERILEDRRANWEAEQLKIFEEKGKTPKNDKWKEKYKEPPKADISLLPEIPDTWVWLTITQLGELNRGKSKHRPRNDPSLYGGDYPFVQTGDVRAADGLLTTYKQTYSEKGLAQSRLWPAGTMCITIAANIAETAILGLEACFPDSVVGFIPQNENVSVEYIEFFFRTAKEDLDRYAPATAQKNINLAILETVSVPFMSVAEQQELVFQVSKKLDATNRAEATIDSKIKKSASFKSSILAKAFSGDLVPNDSNESAQELLDKIKAEKEKLIADKSKAKTKGEKKVTSERKPLLTILSEQSEAVTPDVLMQEAGFISVDIDDFYVELASIAEKIDQISPEQDTLKNWPYEKTSNIKIKLKD
jgi:type I restriction enzyme S subunit